MNLLLAKTKIALSLLILSYTFPQLFISSFQSFSPSHVYTPPPQLLFLHSSPTISSLCSVSFIAISLTILTGDGRGLLDAEGFPIGLTEMTEAAAGTGF